MKGKSSKQAETVPARYARSLLRVAEAQGYDTQALLRSLSLPDNFVTENDDPDSTLPAKYYTLLYNRVMWLLQDESFGLQLKQRTPAGTFRMMCMCIIHCPTLELALRRSAEFMTFCRNLTGLKPLNTRPIKRLEDGTAYYSFPSNEELLEEDVDQDIYTITHCMAIWRRFCGWLVGRNIEVNAVHLQCEEPENPDYFEQLLGCAVVYGQKRNAFILPGHILDYPLVHTEESLRKFLRNAPYHLLVSSEDEDTSLIAQMKRIIGNDLSRDFPSVVVMAEHLNMSVRTLRRRLKEQGTTYQQFKDNLRKEHAIRWLNQPELKINAVSALLGFDEPSAFHRSFKKWTGMTPGEYRNNRTSPGSKPALVTKK